MSKSSSFTISKLAKEAGVGVETIRFYERRGVIRRPSTGRTSFREYPQTDIGRIRFVKRAQELGFTLNEIKEILQLEQNARIPCSDLKKRVDTKIEEVEGKLRDLQTIKKSLKRLSKACDEGSRSVKECRISDCFEKGCC